MRVVTAWLKRGGRALDAAYVYGDQVGVGKAIKASGVPRSEIFLTGKVPSGGGGPGPKAGGGVTMGYNETIDSFNTSLKMLDVEYVDLFLMHCKPHDYRWHLGCILPRVPAIIVRTGPQDTNPAVHFAAGGWPPCRIGQPDWRHCRAESWRALETLYAEGRTKAVGVSN